MPKLGIIVIIIRLLSINYNVSGCTCNRAQQNHVTENDSYMSPRHVKTFEKLSVQKQQMTNSPSGINKG